MYNIYIATGEEFIDMNIAICDDELLYQKQISELLISHFERNRIPLPTILTYSSGEELLDSEEPIDLLFLDIEMKAVDGIFVGNTLKKQFPNIIIIIVTSYMEYLDDAMRFHVFRYLSKPLEQQRFYRNLQDALSLYSTFNAQIAVETKDELYNVNTADIILIEALARKVIVYTLSCTYETSKPMSYFTTILPCNIFFQTHRSYIVNMSYVNRFDKTTVYLNNDSFTAYLTRRKFIEFKKNYLLYLESTR